jgi:hypothetical protein
MTKNEIEALLERPTITPDELFRSRIYPLSRNGIYAAINRGDIAAIDVGKKKAIPTAPIRKQIGL